MAVSTLLGLMRDDYVRWKSEKLSASFNIAPLVAAFEGQAIVTRSG